MRDVIPAQVYERIHAHLERAGNRAQSAWDAGSAQEEALTGHLGARLARNWSRRLQVGSEVWRWRIRYKVFGAGGRTSAESQLGADGLIQIEVVLPDGSITIKGILFQAKKGDLRSPTLPGQVKKMEALATDASAVVVYRRDGYRALSGAALMERVGALGWFSRDTISEQLGTYLANRFLPCETGQLGMYYDAHRNVLTLPPSPRATAVRAALRHRILIEVQGR